MRSTKRERDYARMGSIQNALDISSQDLMALLRIGRALHRWNERECGIDNGCIERDETTGIPYWLNSHTMRRTRIPDREKGAQKALAAIMARYPTLRAYQQSDPRGCALYVLRPGDVPEGQDTDAYYSRGVAVCL